MLKFYVCIIDRDIFFIQEILNFLIGREILFMDVVFREKKNDRENLSFFRFGILFCYISCYCSTEIRSITLLIQVNLNTSHVTVQQM